jgi:AcrR family transcriptional regulator
MSMGIAERKARQRQELRQQILHAARELFVREGYENVSMRKIADMIEYSPASIYTYFKDKDEILDCLCEETFLQLRKRQIAAHQDQKADPLEDLRLGMETYVHFGLEHPDDYIVTFVLRAPTFENGQSCETRKSRAGNLCFDGLRGCVRGCIEAGIIKGADAEETSQAIWAAIHGLTALLITQPGFPFVERERLITRTIEILIWGVSADAK